MRVGLVVGLAVAACVSLLFLPQIPQDASYHQFADQRTIWRIPNFWNVISNAGFLAVAIAGISALRSREAFSEPWERVAYGILLGGVALVAFGSAYYHADPNDATLFWDRLPMTIVFMSLLATTIGERISMRAGRLLLLPLLVVGIASIGYWKISGDLRPYVVVQFYPMVALPLMLVLFPAKYTGVGGIVAMIVLYGVAKIFEFFDHPIGNVIATGGHPWKHFAGVAAMCCYVVAVGRRKCRRPDCQYAAE